MGRQNHLTRLSLGRSPFGPPLRDENGDLILGPHTHDDDATDYVQQFNDRGHPTNKTTDLHNKRLRRAQNEVLLLAGVVRSKNDENQPDEWKSMEAEQRTQLVKEENELMRFVGFFDRSSLEVVTTPISAFRYRLMTFESYLGPPLLPMLRSETRILGLRETLFAGLPLSLCVGLSQRLRTLMLYALPEFRTSLLTIRSKYQYLSDSKLNIYLWELLWFAIEWPLAISASLQALHLLPSTVLLGPSTTLSILSIFCVDQVPTLPQSLTPTNIGAFCISWLGHPFIVSYLLDQIRESLHSGIHAIWRFRLPIPNEPDSISERARPKWRDEHHMRAQIPGFGYEVDAKRRYYGPNSFQDSLRMAFPMLSKLLYAITGYPAMLRSHLTPENEESLRKLCDLRYGDLWRENRHYSGVLRVEDSRIRRRAVIDAFSQAGIDPAQDSISIATWAAEIRSRANEGSTPTPDPLDLFSTSEVHEAVVLNQVDDSQPMTTQDESDPQPEQPETEADTDHPNSPTIDASEPDFGGQAVDTTHGENPVDLVPSRPLETLLLPVNTGDSISQEPTNHTPVPGISRAMSLEQAPLRPVRRPTEIGAEIDGEFFTHPNHPIESIEHSEQVYQEPDEAIQHRVTLLSNYPAEILALYGSTLITSIIMLPFDMFYHRRLAATFLSSPRVRTRYTPQLLEDVLPTYALFGGGYMSPHERMAFASRLIMTFGVQALIGVLSFKGARWSTLFLAREYGWGKI